MPWVTAFSTMRLQQQRRHEAAAGIAGAQLGAQPIAETHALDRQKAIEQRQLPRQRDPILAAERQASHAGTRRAAGTSAAPRQDPPSSAR